MTAYKDLSKDELKALKKELTRKFEEVKAKGLTLDMSAASLLQSSSIFRWE